MGIGDKRSEAIRRNVCNIMNTEIKKTNFDAYGRLFIAIFGYEFLEKFWEREEVPERLRKVIKLRFGLEDGVMRTLEESGEEFGVTRERIRQMQAKSLEMIRRGYGLGFHSCKREERQRILEKAKNSLNLSSFILNLENE